MGTSANILFLSFAIPVIAKSIDYQPISIIVNENFNTQPSETPQGTAHIPKFVHQGANFYFNPQVKFPARLFPPHILALLSSAHQKNESIVVQKEPAVFLGGEQILEILRPNEVYPIIDRGDIIEENLLPNAELVLEEGERVQTPPETPILEPIILPVNLSASKPIEVIAEDNFETPLTPMSPQNQPETVIQEFIAIPEAPVLSSIPTFFPTSIITEEIVDSVLIPEEFSISKPIVVGEENAEIPPISLPIHNKPGVGIQELVTIPEAPILPPMSINFQTTDEINREPILESIAMPGELSISGSSEIVNEEYIETHPITLSTHKPETITEGLIAIPEAPVLPSLPINSPTSIITEPVLDLVNIPAETPMSRPEIIAEANIEMSPMPLPFYKPDADIQELVPIPEAPVLPPLSINFSTSIITEETNREPALDLVAIPAEMPISRPEIIGEEYIEISPMPLPIHEPEAVIQELVPLPEAPVLPPMSINFPTSIITEEINQVPILDSVDILAELPISKPGIIAEENIVTHKPETVIEELVPIPETPVLPPLSINFPTSIITEEITRQPALELVNIPAETPMSRPGIIAEANIEMSPMPLPFYKPDADIQELVPIPEAPVLPPLSINFLTSIITEETNREPALELVNIPAETPISRPEIIEENIEISPMPLPIRKPEAVIQELVPIPEAPVLPPLSINFPTSIITEEINQEPILNSVDIMAELPISRPGIIAEENIEIYPEPLPIHNKPDAIIQDILTIPESPVSPSIPSNFIPSISMEEINQEPTYDSIGLPEVYTISKPVEVINEETVVIPSTYTKPGVIQEVPPAATTLPHLSIQYLPSDAEVNEIQKPGSIEVPVDLSPQPAVIQELYPIPDGPILSPINFDAPVITEEANKIPIPETVGLVAEFPTFQPPKVVIEESFSINSLPIPDKFNPIYLPTKFPIHKPIQVIADENINRPAVPIPINGEHFIVQEFTDVSKVPNLPTSCINVKPTVIKEDVKLEIPNRPTHVFQNFLGKPYVKDAFLVKKNLNPAVPSNLFNLAPFQFHKTKPMTSQVIKYQVPNINQSVPFPKFNMSLHSKNQKKNRFVFLASCARNIVSNRIMPYMRRKGQTLKLFKIVS